MTAPSIVSVAMGALVATLGQAPAVAPTIDRVRLRPWSKGVTRGIAVRPNESQPGQLALSPSAPTLWTTLIDVECYARAAPSETADAAVDALMVDTYGRLMADPTLGGTLFALEPIGVHFEFDVDGEKTACAILHFSARHRGGQSTFTP